MRRAPGAVARLLLAAAIAAICLLPLLRLIWTGLADDPGELLSVLGAPVTGRAALHTLLVSLGAAAVAGVLGGGFALLAGLTDLPRRGTLTFLFTLLLIIPSQVTAIAWIELLGPASPVLAPLGLAAPRGSPNPLFGPGGIVFLLGIEQAPLVFLVLRAGLRAIPAELVEAARGAGAGPLRVLGGVVLPLAAPSFAAALALAAVAAAGNFGTVALLGIPGRYPVLTTLIYQRLTGFGPSMLGAVAALSLILVAVALAGCLAESLLAGPRKGLEGAAAAGPLFHLGRWRHAAASLCWAGLILLLFMPLAALIGTALVRAYGLPLAGNTTLGNFRSVLFGHPATQRALANSFILATSAGLVLALVAVAACHGAERGRSRLLRLTLAAADLPYAVPGTVLAVACILAFLRPVAGIALYDTLWIILVAYLAHFLALTRRPVAAALRALDPRLEEAAQSAGAGAARRLGTIVLPLVAPSAAAGALIVFLTAFNELTLSALLWSTGHETMGVEVFSYEQAGEIPLAAALSCISAAVTVTLMAASTLAARRLPRGTLPWAA